MAEGGQAEQPSVEKKGLEPASRGIPSKESIWYSYSKLPMAVTARWEAEDLLKLVFPPQFKGKQYEVALKLVQQLSTAEQIDGDSLARWQQENGIANSTLRNLVIPRLISVGMLARERVNPTGQTEKDKRHAMVLKLSLRFGEAFQHVGQQWNSIVETWRVKRTQAQGGEQK
ncbi:MAG: hypothetical protein V1787_03975 [Candidatus Micrarchaeota archaeon]